MHAFHKLVNPGTKVSEVDVEGTSRLRKARNEAKSSAFLHGSSW
jgi:hypothetical protein